MKRLLIALSAALTFSAFARQGVPVVDFTAVPLQAPAPLSLSQAKRAIMQAAVIEGWDPEPIAEGKLRLTTIKEATYELSVLVDYSATQYSLRYENSDGMGYERRSESAQFSMGGSPVDLYADAARRQKERLKKLPNVKYGTPRALEVIHPSYEVWAHELMGAIRGQVKLAGMRD